MRLPLGEALEILGALVLITASAAVGALFHRVALGALFALVLTSASAVYFAHVFQDVTVKVSVPKLPRRQRKQHVIETQPGVTLTCGVCNNTRTDHTECNKVVTMSYRRMKA